MPEINYKEKLPLLLITVFEKYVVKNAEEKASEDTHMMYFSYSVPMLNLPVE